jgi:hypothetical protein
MCRRAIALSLCCLVLVACGSPKSDDASDTVLAWPNGKSDSTVAVSHAIAADDSVPLDLRDACERAGSVAKQHGAAQVALTDTAVAPDRFGHAGYHGCVVHATEFDAGRGIDPDLYKRVLLGPRWVAHPFEGSSGDSTYGLVRDSTQCEATVLGPAAASSPQRIERGKAAGFHIVCYRD